MPDVPTMAADWKNFGGYGRLRPIEEQIVRGVVDYVEEHYAASISLRDVAKAV